MLKPGTSKIFQEYSGIAFLPYVTNQLRNVDRVDVVWDRYFPGSRNDSARSKGGKGVRRRVRADTKIPGNWTAFFRLTRTKKDLFHFLADQLTTIGTEHGEVVSTKDESTVLNSDRGDTANLEPCKHEEADTVDTDVVVIAVATFHKISLLELWIEFVVGKHLRYLPAHDISRHIGQEKSQALHHRL